MDVTPDITVVMASYNRRHEIGRAVASVLDQAHRSVELVVADCSTDGTPELLAEVRDPRLRVVFPPDLGMPVSRNEGLAAAHGTWVGFLDDDDRLLPGWAERLLTAADDDVGVVLGGMDAVGPDGELQTRYHPELGDPPPVFVAGSFIVRRSVLEGVGGMLEGLPMAHHWELGVRVGRWCRAHGLRMVVVDEPVVEIVRRPPAERTMATPLQAYDAMRWVRVRHAALLATAPSRRAVFAANAGVPAARLGYWPAARRWFAVAVRDRPTDLRTWGRLALAAAPPVARRVWGDRTAFAPELSPALAGIRGLDRLDAARGRSVDRLMLPDGYRQRATIDATLAPSRVEQRARLAADRLAHRRRFPGPVEILAGVLERAEDPRQALADARKRVGAGGWIVVGTPDRRAVDGSPHVGPPSLPGVRRLWEPDELHVLLDSCGLTDVEVWPRVPVLRSTPRRDGAVLAVARVAAGDP